jgi:hypothetical protein
MAHPLLASMIYSATRNRLSVVMLAVSLQIFILISIENSQIKWSESGQIQQEKNTI